MRHATSKVVAGSNPNMGSPLALARAMGAALLVSMTAAAHAQSTGIAACDNFLAKYDTCIASKLPEAQRALYKSQFDQTRKMWLDISKNPANKPAMHATGEQTS